MKEADYIKKWLNESLNEDEKAAFEQSKDFEFVERLSRALVQFKAPIYDANVQYERLGERKADKKVIALNPSFIWLKVAASVLLIMGLAYFFVPRKVNEIANKSELMLPDASAVVLNTHSNLTYDENTWSSNRQAFLEGEGFFEVTTGSQFDVVTKSGVVSVLGTAFNIKDRENFFEVKCYHGLVKVTVNNEEILLTAQQTYRIVDGVERKSDFKEVASPSWINGESSFEQVPYIQVVEEFERQYQVSIAYENINTQLTFSGKFTHSDLTLALESITKPLNLGFQIIGRQVRLTSDIK